MNDRGVNGIPDISQTFCEVGLLGKLHSWIKMLDVLALLVPATQFIEIHAVGRLFMPDLLLAFILPMLFVAHGKRLCARLPKIFILLAIIWFFSQVATDIFRATDFSDYIRGWAKIASTLVNFAALYLLLYGHPRRLILYAVGMVVGGGIGYFINPTLYAVDMPWKFGYGVPATLSLVLLAVVIIEHRRIGPYVAGGVLLAAAALNIFMGFRSLGGICFLAACYLFIQFQWGRWVADQGTRVRQMLLFGILLAISSAGLFQVYDYSARSGLLGQDAKEKYEGQAAGEYGLLLGGRSELLVSSRAILDSPFFGHGSWAKDDQYSSLLTELRRQADYIAVGEDEEGLIPTHSHLLGAWVEAGIMGAVFWAWVLSLPVRILLRPYSVMDHLTPLTAFFAFFLIWDIFFSPYGAERRFLTPYYVVVMMTYIGTYSGKVIV
jgi:hypothetical protein